MGDLILLPRPERPSRHASMSDHSAEILFFTGVRYYRVTDEMPSPVAKPRRRRRISDVSMDVGSRIDRQA